MAGLPGALKSACGPAGGIPGGLYADGMTQTACAVLALAERLAAPATPAGDAPAAPALPPP